MNKKYFSWIHDILEAFSRGLKDFRTRQMLFVLLAPFVLSVVCVWISWRYIAIALESLSQGYDFSSQWYSFAVDALLQLMEIMGIFLYFVILVVLIQMLFSIFYTPFVIRYLHQRYYADMPQELGIGTGESFKRYLKVLFLFVLFLCVCFPLYFIPVVNVLIFYTILFFFFKEMMILDVLGSVISPHDFHYFLKRYKISIRCILLGLYLLSLIPLINFLIPIFQILVFSHFVFLKKRDFIIHQERTIQ